MGRRSKNVKYVISEYGEIYKIIAGKDYILKLTPWKLSEDRRLFIENNKLPEGFSKINFEKAKKIINLQWDADEREWQFDNTIYKVYNSLDTEYKHTHDCHNNRQLHHYDFEHEFKTGPLKGETYTSTYYLCMFQGKVYWVYRGQYFPRLALYKFKDIQTEPGEFVQWTSAKHCKLIYNTETNESI